MYRASSEVQTLSVLRFPSQGNGKTILQDHIFGQCLSSVLLITIQAAIQGSGDKMPNYYAKLNSRLLRNAMGHPGWSRNTHHNTPGMHF